MDKAARRARFARRKDRSNSYRLDGARYWGGRRWIGLHWDGYVLEGIERRLRIMREIAAIEANENMRTRAPIVAPIVAPLLACQCGEEGTIRACPYVKDLYNELKLVVRCDNCQYEAARCL